MLISMNDTDWGKIIQSLPVQVWIALPDGALNFVNATVCDYFRRTADEIVGEGWLSSLHPADIAPTIERWTHALQTGTPYAAEFRLRRDADRLYYWHFAQATPVRDNAGTITEWIGCNTNIDDLKRMVEVADARQELVKRDRDRLFRAFRNSPASVSLYSGPEFVIEMVNERWQAFTGKRNILGRPIRDVLPEIAAQGVIEILEEVFRTGEPYHATEIKIVHDPDGDGRLQETYWNIVYQSMGDSGQPVREILGHAVEVTDLVLARRRVREIEDENDRLRGGGPRP